MVNMLQAQAQVRPRQRPGITNADSKLRGKRSPFSRYKDEKERVVRAPKVKEDATLAQLKTSWIRFSLWRYDWLPEKAHYNYLTARNGIENIEYTARDVEKFCVVLAAFQDDPQFSRKAGLFLSALVNHGKDDRYTIVTRHFHTGLHMLGYGNIKHVTVDGNGGSALGIRMKEGSITVKGNTSYRVGVSMEGGIITVEGNAGDEVAYLMKGGEIHLKKGYEFVYPNKDTSFGRTRGKVFHNGILIAGNPTAYEWLKSLILKTVNRINRAIHGEN